MIVHSPRPGNITLALDAARAAGIPVITIQHDAPATSPVFAPGSDGWQLHPAIADFAADHHIHKTMGSAFVGTDLRAWLSSHAIDTLTITGYMTHNCDAATIYQASHDGLQVEFLIDANGSLPYGTAAGKASLWPRTIFICPTSARARLEKLPAGMMRHAQIPADFSRYPAAGVGGHRCRRPR